jgi:hypothetical protein
VKVAIVSANAFDKGLDNDVGIRPEDFILKPVRHTELLDWLERQLGLRWLQQAAPAAAPPADAPTMLCQCQPPGRAAPSWRRCAGGATGLLPRHPEPAGRDQRRQPGVRHSPANGCALAQQFQFEAMARALGQAPRRWTIPHHDTGLAGQAPWTAPTATWC